MYSEYSSSFGQPHSGQDSAFARAEEALRHAKRDTHRHSFHFGGGAALVLIVLIIISLLCFAALCIISAHADEKLTDRYEEEVSEFYRAQNLGTEFIAQANASLQQIYNDIAGNDAAGAAFSENAAISSAENRVNSDSAAKAAYYTAAKELDGCIDPSDEEFRWHDVLQELLFNTGYQKEAENTPLLVFSAPVNDNEVYLVVARVHLPDSEDPSYLRVLSAKTVSTITYDYDTTLNVMKRS